MFRRNVSRRAEYRKRAGELACGIEPFCQSEVAHHRLAARIEQNISGFEISVKNSLLVSVIDGSRDRCDQLDGTPWRIAKALPGIEQTSTGGEFHAEKWKPVFGRADVVNGQDIRMIEAGGCSGFALKSRQGLPRIAVIIQHSFQGNDAPRGRVPRTINHPHAATTDFFQDTIAAQLPVPVRDIDRGEKRVEILDARFVRTKATAQ